MNTLFSITNIFNKTDVVDILSIAIGTIGILVTFVSVVCTIFSLQKAKPKYTIVSENRKKSHTKVPNNAKNQQPMVSKIAIWDTGKTLLNTDVIKKAPLCIKTTKDDVNIIDCKVIYSEEINGIKNVSISKDRKSISFDFDLLRAKEGFVLKVHHNGQPEFQNFHVEGSLIDGGEIKYIRPYTPISSIFRAAFFMSMGLVYFGTIVLLLSGYNTDVIESIPKFINAVWVFSIGCLSFYSIKMSLDGFSSLFIPEKIAHSLFHEDPNHKSKFEKFLEKHIDKLFKPVETKKNNDGGSKQKKASQKKNKSKKER